MAQPVSCCLPRFGTSLHGPKRPASLRARTSPSHTLQLLAAWDRGQLDSLLKASWALLLHRYTGLEDICFGYQPIGVDEHNTALSSDIHNHNLLTFNFTITEDDSVHSILRHLEGTNNAERCRCSSSSGHSYTLCNTILMLRNCRSPAKDARAPLVQPALAIPLPSQCRVRLHVKVLQEDVGIFLEWWNNDMSTEHMKSIADYFEQILARVLSAQDTLAKDLNHFSDRDWSRVCKFNSAIPTAHDRCIHEVIHEQVLIRPESEAVCAWDGSLTYRDLDLLSSQVAYRLYAHGVGPETCVALCFNKSKWNIVAMLGVLKAGGAFVPLDPTHPTSRLQSLVRAVKAKVLLCSRGHVGALTGIAETLVPLDQIAIDEFSLPAEEVPQLPEVKGYNAAYVIFTSGSTGEPKGTMLEHRAYVSGAFAHATPHHMFSTSRVLQFAAHTFDASLVEILTTLLIGGCVCVPSEEERLSDIVKVINEMNVNHAILTPSFVEFVDSSQVPGLETLILAGEAMSQGQLVTWSSALHLINAYGPTESSVAAVVNSKVTPSSDCRDIGLPVGVRCWLVDPSNHDQLVPVGCPGELVLEGPTLARCYLNNPQKTNEAFIHNPAWIKNDDVEGSDRRMYKTGDLVRYNSDCGSLTYIGRKDTQVKFHGQRLELGEIENTLAADPIVKHCLAFLSKSGFSAGKIVAVIPLSVHFESQSDPNAAPLKLLEPSKKAPIVAEVRERLSSQLPTYMIPSVWLCVEALPLLASGKLDRKATANWIGNMEEDPDAQPIKSNSLSMEKAMYPFSATEEQLALIWSRVLNIPRNQIGLDEGFLSLGGDSIAAITCLGYCKKQGMGLTVQEVLHSKSISELATRVKRVDQSIVYKEQLDEPFDLSPIQKLHFMVRNEGQGHFNQSIVTRLNKHIEEHDIRRAIEAIVNRHSMLRSRLIQSEVEGGLQQRITHDVAGSYRLQSHSDSDQSETDAAISNSQSCIDAFVGPVLAIDVFYKDNNSCLLSLVAHHLVVDIVSWRIILEDLEDLLINPNQTTSQGGSLPFQSWCQIQADRCQTSTAEWAMDLPIVPAPDFAYWGLDTHRTTYGDVDCETFELDSDVTHHILMGCHRSLETEPIDVFLAALLHSFGQTFKDRSLPIIYNEGHGREVWDSSIDISRTVGWFTILYPILLSSLPAEDPTETVIRVKDLRRRVSDNGRQDFARRMLSLREDGSCLHHSPMEVSFNYVGQHRDLQRKDGLFQLMDQMAGETGRGGGAADFGEDTPRFALFEISAMVVQGKLRFIFSFNRNMQHQKAIRGWVTCCQTLLQSLGEQLQFLPPRPTLSSFPMLTLTYEELETLVSKKLPSAGVNAMDDVEDIYPCSSMQQGILLSRSRDSSLYAVHDTFEVKGSGHKPDIGRLTLAWQKVVDHHAMLRTIFPEGLNSRDLYCQVVLKAFDSQPTFVICADETEVLSTFDKQQPMMYNDKQPPHRLTICQTTSGKLFCRLELNHVAMDGASISIIVRDLQLAYQGKLEDPKPKFKEYVRYLREVPQEASIDYWRTYLSDVEPCSFPVLNDGHGSVRRLRTKRLECGPFKALQSICEKNGLTLPTAFSAAWGLTLRSFCETDDVSFTYLASLRDVPVEGIESVVGPVINTLTCRIKFPEGALLKDILGKVQEDNLDNLPHRHVSLVTIQQALNLSDSLANSGISYRKLPNQAISSREEIQLSEVGTIHDPAESPIFINVEATDDEAHIDLNYWTDHLSEGQAANVASTFLKSLENIAEHFEDEIHRIDNLSEANKQQLTLWNAKVPEAVDKCIHEVLDEYSKSEPNAVAIAAWDESLTYSKLSGLSSLLATYLTKLGVGPGTLVPIDFARSSWQIVAILAVLQAGGICIPVDLNCMPQPFETWLTDNEIQIALASPTRAQLLENAVPYVIPVGRSLFEYLPDTETTFKSPAQPWNDGYVVFSAAISKAITLEHRAVTTRARAFASALGLSAKTRMLQYAPFTSDMFLQEVFGTLVCGGCVCIPSDDGLGDLPKAINMAQANCVSITPSTAMALQPADVPGLEVLALWGERSSEMLLATWSKKVQLHALYGTPECSSTCIQYSKSDEWNGLPLIGSNAGCISWLVDPCNHDILVPIGCVGELMIEGPGLSRGYLHNEELTRRKFVENPAWRLAYESQSATGRDFESSESHNARHRLFKTGDLARYNPDGTLVYVGKKGRGFHWQQQTAAMHLEQQIASLSNLSTQYAVEIVDQISEAVPASSLAVFIFDETSDSKNTEEQQLIAQMTPELHDLTMKLHAKLSGALPENMIPSLYFPMLSMPLSSFGKLNRQLLRDAAQRLPGAALLRYDIKSFNDFWRAHLADSTASHEFPSPPRSPSLQSASITKQATKTVQVSWCDALKSTTIGLRCALLSAWALTIHGYTGSDNVVFGESLLNAEIVLTDSRDSHTQSAAIVPRHFKIDNGWTVTELLNRVKNHLTATEPYQWAGVRQIQNLNADTARACKFKNSITILDMRNQRSGFTREQQDILSIECAKRYPLVVSCIVDDSGFELVVRYDGSTLSDTQLERLTAQFLACVELLISDASMEKTISDLSRDNKDFCSFRHDVAYWKNYLDDVEACLFPSLRASAEQTTYAEAKLVLSDAEKLQAFCESANVSTNSLLQLVWGLVLRCYTGLREVCFGYQVSGTSHRNGVSGFADSQVIAGIFACRMLLEDEIQIEEVLKKRLDGLDQMLQHQLPFPEVQQEVGYGDGAIFNTVFSYSEKSVDACISQDVDWSTGLDTITCMIAVNAVLSGSSGEISFEYSTRNFSDADINGILDCFKHILDSIVNSLSVGTMIGDIDFVSELSCRKISEWNSMLPDRPMLCAHELIQQQALNLASSAPAICSWDGDFTHEQLDQLSTRLAHHLVRMGVKPDVFVALCFEKSAWAVVAQVAVLKAGGAFASLDPTHPESRLKGMVEDLDAQVILCSETHYEKASAICHSAVIVSNSAIHRLPHAPSAAPTQRVTADNAAYAIFTSGTTGKPKVTVLEHVGLTLACTDLARALHIDSNTRALQFSSYTFDVSILEIIIVLAAGGCVCVPSEDERLNNLSGAIRRMDVSFMSATPSIVNTMDPKAVPSLRTLILGGEKMTASHFERWADRCIFNAYGPSEATIAFTASAKFDHTGAQLNDDYGSIGTAICGRTWVVDSRNHNRLVPVGAVGELVLEGCTVARGYLNNDEKTRAVFVRNPEWTQRDGLQHVLGRKERMYRTGDLVRYNSDGSLGFISRIDTQVKLNGVRIELEEVEQQCIRILSADTQVAVEVVAPEAKTVAKCLAAFFIVDEHENQEDMDEQLILPMTASMVDVVQKLHESLVESLPLAMVPKLYFPMRRLLFGSTGKTDRKALRAMVDTLSKERLKPYVIFNIGAEHFSNVGTEGMEGALRELWEEALNLAPGSISAEDNFFGLGGDSFSAMKLVVSAASLGISLTVADIYKTPIFRDMANNCGALETQAGVSTVEPFAILPQSLSLEDILEEVSSQCGVPKEQIADLYPCSPVQEGLLTLSIKQSGAYVARPVFQLAEGADLKKFKVAWQKVVDEMDILRTRIVHTETANFVQAVLTDAPISWDSATDFDSLSNESIDLARDNGGLLTGYGIVEPEAFSKRYFVWTIHHALYDGWSVAQILRRVEEVYGGSSNPSPALPYKLFIKHLVEQDAPSSDEFWRTHLAGISSSPFPQNKPSPDAIRVGNRHYSSVEVSRAPNGPNLTVPEMIRAAWAMVVSVHTGSGDVCFAETLMGRNIDMPGAMDIAGPVLTTVPTRIAVDNELSVIQYLQSVRQLTTVMMPHLHAGLQRIRKLSSDTALACESQNLLVIQSEEGQPDTKIWEQGHNLTEGDFFTHPIVVECKIGESQVAVTLHHDELVFDSWQAQMLIGQFTHVLGQLFSISNDETRKVGDLEVSSPRDKEEITSWNQRDLTCIDRCVHHIIEEKVSLRPQAPAICSWDGQLSYQELYHLSSSFAAYLRTRGIGPETLVPICMDKSLWAVVTILGVLIAGGAFVPLDPAHPTSRHREILAEVEARVVLCSPKYHNRYAGAVKAIIPVSKETIKAYCALIATSTRGSDSATPTNMAFAIFTSGSTGRAKGIIINHRALASSGMAFGPMVHLNENSRAFQFASLTFDAAVMEVLVTLMHGGCVCIPSEDERLNDVAGAIRRMDVSWSFLTPSIASIIEPSSVPSLKDLVCGGEKMSREVITKWAHRVNLMNGYGPTETTIFAVINTNVAANPDPACIGHGIPCTLTWVVDPDDHNKLTPLGAVGELALEGPALAREYLKNPKKTAEAFVDEPEWIKSFPSDLPSPRRIYKTGDLVKYNSDGSVEYIGRKDHQVKLHGQRMELGEIEHRLYEDPRVRHAVVILPTTGPLKQRLVTVLSLNSVTAEKSIISDNACELIGRDGSAQSAYQELVTIQKSLETQLPIYMVPQAWALIKQLPMLVSGKLDRKRITAWLERIDDASYDRIMEDYDSIKRGEVEQEEEEDDKETSVKLIKDIVSQVLNLPAHKVDSDRSFVSLGGDSITGMAVISRARKHGLAVTLHGVLQTKSIKELALATETKVQTVRREEKSHESFELSPIQGLFVHSATGFRDSTRFNQSMTVRVTRKIEPKDLENAIKAVVKQHSMFRARLFKSRDGKWQQKITDEVDASYSFHHHAVDMENAIMPKIAESQRSVDVQHGPIVAADLFEVRGGMQVLFLVASHICVDMVSWRIVLQDIQDFLDTGSLSVEKPLSFQAWCNLQLEESKKLKGRNQLPFSIQPPDLSYWGMEQSPNLYGHVKMEGFALDATTSTQILGACHGVLRTEAIEVILSAVVHSFRRTFTDRAVPTIYNEGHGREAWDSSIDLSRTVGWFTTMCPLHVGDGSDLLDTLKRVKDMRRHLASKSRPYFAESLLDPEGKQAGSFPVPLEILFNYLGQLQQLERDDSLFQHYGDAFNAETFELAGDMGSKTSRFALFEISALIIKDKIQVSFTYNQHMGHQQKIHGWISECKRVLEEDMLRLGDFAPEPTLSDYPLLPITYDGLNSMVKNTFPKVGLESWSQVEDIYPCSPVQEGILLSQLRDPKGYLFHVIFDVRHSKGNAVDTNKLRKAWAMVVSRHPVLRSVFIDSNYKGGSFDQVVVKALDDAVIEFQCPDSDALGTLGEIQLRDINAERSTKLPHQVTLCKTSSGRVLFKIEMNHAVIDGGSVDLLLRDLALAYNDQLPAGTGPLFSDYVKYIKGQAQEETAAHWVQYLSGVQPCHLSFSSATGGSHQLGERMINFKRFPELQKFCEENSVTLANLTLCAWAIVLQNCTGSDDVCFGYPSAGRDSPVPGIQDAVGIFINMLCCRVKFAPGQTLLDIARKVQDDFIKNVPHQHCSLAQIQHELGWHGETLFNTTLSIQNRSAHEGAGKQILEFEVQKAHDPTEYPVTVNVETTKGREGVLLRYWSNTVTGTQAKDLADAITKVFTCFVEEPSKLVSSLNLRNKLSQNQISRPKEPIIVDQLIDSYALQKMIDDRVNEIIGQMLKKGKLAIPRAQSQETRYSHGSLHLKMVEASFQENEISDEKDLANSTPSLTDDGRSSTDNDRRLWDLWKSTLELSSDSIQYRSSFFKLGGDSITAMKIVSAAREEGLQMTVADVFNNPVFEDMLAVVAPRSSPTSNAETQCGNNIEELLEADDALSDPTPPQDISVLRPMQLDAMSLLDVICPKIGVFKGGIADVLPVTDFQSMSIAATLFGSRWMLNYFFLDGNGPLDIRRLRESFLRVVDAFDILRTVFVCHRGQFFQVVLRKIRPDIFVHETEQSLDEFTNSLQKRDREQDPRQGEQYVQFYIVKKKQTDQHRILIRMSHAQFDGVCLPKIMNAIKLGYEGSTLPPVFSFSNYMRMLPGNITPVHYHHWSTILKGSKMTEIIRRTKPNTFMHIGAFAEQKKTIVIPSTAIGNVTLATVMQSAWAVTLAKLTAQSDVVFGLTVNGRNASVPGIETTVGPCLNILPIRVKFREHWSGLDLFRYLQDQQIANMPYESLGFREIIRNCTDWPDSTYFTTSVFHQNVEYEGQMHLDGNPYRMGGVGVLDNFTDLTLASKSCGQEKLDVSIGYSLKGPIPPAFITKALNMVCETVQSLIANPSVPLASPATIRSLPSQVIHEAPSTSDAPFLSSNLNSQKMSEIVIHSDILTRAWQQVLPRRTHNVPYQLDASFFGLGGDIMNVAQLVWILEEEGFQVRLEDLLEHHTFLGQMAVMAMHHQKVETNIADATTTTEEPAKDMSMTMAKSNSWSSLGKAMTLAKRFTKWGSVTSRK
ncbi:nonribosomal peptide synthase Pes1 [Aspergillus sclerotioniger CBS 115572]|uniref:Nonribosomal peptide synthase Pes1 n=1 Tax=Aspergillus sclerotioniger CBS 115572 TaxID=1450535 RepID=A0A317W961_9EURO|nr:nonribosomal peptide synthase Pes1 [Aspergillus sclerotioniger CBS 115572]PWY83154.1 nonribosomal peptide synthase Pes1 [Aspergillus sclerotioniger CBS 115572]